MPLSVAANIHEGRGYASILRTDRRRIVSVTADVDETVANANEINRILREEVLPTMVLDFPGLHYTFEGAQRQQGDALRSLAVNFLLAQFAIFALLAIPLKRYTQPLIIMSAIPVGIVGAVLGHIVMGIDLTLLIPFGLVALKGVVVADCPSLVALINRSRSEDVPLKDVIIHSGTRRFRPILLTSLTTFFGLTPIILERSLQARFLVPMAVSLGFGVLFATGITLLLVPCLFAIREDIQRVVLRNGEKRRSPGEGDPGQSFR